MCDDPYITHEQQEFYNIYYVFNNETQNNEIVLIKDGEEEYYQETVVTRVRGIHNTR